MSERFATHNPPLNSTFVTIHQFQDMFDYTPMSYRHAVIDGRVATPIMGVKGQLGYFIDSASVEKRRHRIAG